MSGLVPDTAPRGQGAGGLLTSDLFRLQSQLDEHTQDLIDTQYRLIPVAGDGPEARRELQEVTDRLDGLGFTTGRRDAVLSSFWRNCTGDARNSSNRPGMGL
ncbi:hypothetical protein ACIRQP_41570 [Streptomyces sp. NPDC102274]|uniref:hypothetical protein n=1 Tax=Streptomyces sp. NPDC102274 TaxID=3366151 RepID=UPI003828694D